MSREPSAAGAVSTWPRSSVFSRRPTATQPLSARRSRFRTIAVLEQTATDDRRPDDAGRRDLSIVAGVTPHQTPVLWTNRPAAVSVTRN